MTASGSHIPNPLIRGGEFLAASRAGVNALPRGTVPSGDRTHPGIDMHRAVVVVHRLVYLPDSRTNSITISAGPNSGSPAARVAEPAGPGKTVPISASKGQRCCRRRWTVAFR